jgi:hypothetical protein
LVDVFFRGWGYWCAVSSIPPDDKFLTYHRLKDSNHRLIDSYSTSGHFSLMEKDEIAYHKNKGLEGIDIVYLWRSTHPDDEFRKAVRDGVLVLGKAQEGQKGFIFVIDKSKPEELVIAEPDEPPQAEVLTNIGTLIKSQEKMFDKRLEALKDWLVSLEYSLENGQIKLPKHYTPKVVYDELCMKYSLLFCCITLGTFKSHFWKDQKIVKLTRGNKSAIL